MTEEKEKFPGAYFDRDAVLRLASAARILSWIVLGVYALITLDSLTQLLFQFSSGLFFDKGASGANILSLLSPYLTQPMPGVFYFIGLQAVSQVLLILLDVEDNTRRAARRQ